MGNTVRGSRERGGGSKNIHSWSSEVINDSRGLRSGPPGFTERALSLALYKLVGIQKGREKTLKPSNDSEVGVLIPKLLIMFFKKIRSLPLLGTSPKVCQRKILLNQIK